MPGKHFVMILFPPAKINLGLRVTGKRGDGYHNIESIFYPVPLCDVMEFAPASRFQLTVEGRKVTGSTGQNILTRTWELLHRRFSIPPVEVILLKNIPAGSGLGGGSADAAFFLKGLNDYFHTGLSAQKLSELSLQLGSDVPFFLHNTPALVTGRGEKVQPVSLVLSGLWLVIVFPRISFSSAGMFSLVKPEKPDRSPLEITRLPVKRWPEVLKNDFEEVAFGREPALAEIKSRLVAAGALVASLTGSGSALFALYEEEPDTRALSPWGEIFKYKMK